MKPVLLMLLTAIPGAAQIFPTWVIADPCGGQPAWINSTTIVEESGSFGTPCAYSYKAAAPTLVLYDVKSIVYSGGSWGSRTNLTAALRTSGAINQNCLAGDPASDGTHLVFIVQDNTASNCSSGSLDSDTPSSGTRYNLWACNATSSLSSSNCAMLLQANTGTSGMSVGAILDPHIDGNNIYVSERDPSGISVSWNTWFIDVVPVTWANPPTITSGLSIVRYSPGSWTGYEATNACEQYYKATSFQHLNNGNTRIFTQANQVSNYPNPMSPASCQSIGRFGFSQSGLFYFDLTGGGGAGSNFTQIYPAPASTPPNTPNCFTPSPPAPLYTTACYGEFPLVFPNGNHLFLVFSGQTDTPASLINICASITPCQPNYTQESLVMDLGTNTQNPVPGAVVRQMDSQIPGTPLNAAFLTPPGSSGTGGLPAGYYGGCGHMEVDVPSSQLVCEFNTNIQNSNGVYYDQTVIFPLQYLGSMIFPKTLITGNAAVTGNVKLN